MLIRVSLLLLVTMLSFQSKQLLAEDWPQFLGKARTGVVPIADGPIKAFVSDGLTVRWRVPGGVGMGGVVVVGKRCLAVVQRVGSETLIALDRSTGETLWTAKLAPAYENQMGDGTRATPTVASSRVYTFTGEGILSCHSLDKGKQVWTRNIVKEGGGKVAEYGNSSSPLVVDGKVIVQTGAPQAALTAVSAESGKTAWTAGRGSAGYSSPCLLNVGGSRQVVAFLGGACIGVDPGSGKELWSYPFKTAYDCNTASPVAVGDRVFISSGENHGSVLLDVPSKGNGEPEVVWSSLGTKSAIRSEWQTPLLKDGFLYGFDNVGSAGPVTNLACVDALSGEVKWKKMRFGKANGILVGNQILICNMDGELILVEANPDGFNELARAQVLEGKTRQAPAFSDGDAFLRDDKEIVCVQLR